MSRDPRAWRFYPTDLTTEQADWIAEHVLTARMLDGYGPQRTCACYYGVCGACQANRLNRKGTHACVIIGWGGAQPVSDEATITDRGAFVKGGLVWRAGKPCRWVCACPCDPYAPELLPVVVPPAVEQLGLFDLAGA